MKIRATLSGIVAIMCLLILPGAVYAGTAVVFFEGLCNSPDACAAIKQANTAMVPRLPDGARLIAPNLVSGAFPNQSGVNSLVSSLGSDPIVFIAYSAGNKALWQVVSAMTTDSLKRVKTVISLEGNYSGFTNSVARIRAANPKVEVQYFTSSQFGTNHGRLPGSSGVADAIGKIADAAQTGGTADLSGLPPASVTGQQTVAQATPASWSSPLYAQSPNILSSLTPTTGTISSPASTQTNTNAQMVPTISQDTLMVPVVSPDTDMLAPTSTPLEQIASQRSAEFGPVGTNEQPTPAASVVSGTFFPQSADSSHQASVSHGIGVDQMQSFLANAERVFANFLSFLWN